MQKNILSVKKKKKTEKNFIQLARYKVSSTINHSIKGHTLSYKKIRVQLF